MIESLLFATALKLLFHLAMILFIAVGIGAVVGGVLRVVTQIDDPAISFISRFGGLSVLVLWGAQYWSKELFQFALRVWSGSDIYH